MPEISRYKWRVKRSEHGMSLENYLYKQMGDWSHKKIKDAIDRKRAFVNGKNVFVSKWNVKHNDRIDFVPSSGDFPDSAPIKGNYRFVKVLFEDSYIIVADKPPFIDHETFANSVQEYMRRKNAGGALPYLGQLHRLDKETTGVMIFTKKKIANTLADQFRRHTIRKKYLAVVQGYLERDEGRIVKPIEKGEFEEGRKVRIAEDEAGGKNAETHFRVIERYENASLLRLEIKTGRTHQIRIHMSDEGHPLVGDKLYGKPVKGLSFRRQALHAESLEFLHPVTNKKIRIEAPVHKDMAELIDRLRGI